MSLENNELTDHKSANVGGTSGLNCAEAVPPAARAPRVRGGFVYFITDGEAVKIGISVSVSHRLADLQPSHPRPLRVIASFPGSRADERAAHRHFAHLRIHGEWFHLSQEITDFIAELEAGRPLLGWKATITDATTGRLRDMVARRALPGMRAKLKAWVLERRQNGWESRELEVAAERALLALNTALMNKPHPITDRMLAESIAALEAVRGTVRL